jgi:hypothetical protein
VGQHFQLVGARTRAEPFHWQMALNPNNVDPLAMKFEQLRDCFKKLRNNGFVGQLKEAHNQHQEEKRIAKKCEQEEAGNKLETQNNAATSNEKQPAEKLKVGCKWCEKCHTPNHQGSQCWHKLKKEQAAGNNSTATEGSAGNEPFEKSVDGLKWLLGTSLIKRVHGMKKASDCRPFLAVAAKAGFQRKVAEEAVGVKISDLEWSQINKRAVPAGPWSQFGSL